MLGASYTEVEKGMEYLNRQGAPLSSHWDLRDRLFS